MIKKGKNMNKSDFIHAVAARTGYTLKDTEIFLEGFSFVLEEAIKRQKDIDFRGFFHLTFRPVKGGMHTFKKGVAPKLYSDGIRIIFSLAKNLKVLVKREV
jgi:nucleoid DNA-binding protein